VTLLTPDPLSSRSAPSTSNGGFVPSGPFTPSIPRRPQVVPPTHSIPENPDFPHSPRIIPSSSVRSIHGNVEPADHEHAIDFATHSWDLATGGLKTLTAKRELPIRPDRRVAGVVPDMFAASHGYMFVLVILVCVVLMLVGGGMVLFVMLQP
jgi:hypothetical protein